MTEILCEAAELWEFSVLFLSIIRTIIGCWRLSSFGEIPSPLPQGMVASKFALLKTSVPGLCGSKTKGKTEKSSG